MLATYAWPSVTSPRGSPDRARSGRALRSLRPARGRPSTPPGYLVHAHDHRGHGQSITGTPGDFGNAGFDGLIADTAAYGATLREDRPDLPLFLIAHSMGSFAAQSVLLEHSDAVRRRRAVGSTALDVLAADLARSEGPVGLEAFNAGFEHRTGYEWLSRDEAEVDAYVADPLCGFDLPEATVPSLFGAAGRLADPRGADRDPIRTCRS